MTPRHSLSPTAFGAALLLFVMAPSAPHAGRDHLHAEDFPRRSPATQSRLMPVDVSRLDAARTEVLREAAAMLPVNLFDRWSCVIERAEKTGTGYALSGRVAGRPLSSVTIVVNGEVVAGMVNADGETWHVRSRGAGVVEIRKSEGPFRCGAGADTPFTGRPPAKVVASDPADAVPAADQDDGDEIDVLVVFTEAARRRDGGFTQIRANVDLAVAATNEAYRVSGVRQRVNLVAAVQIDYRESTVHGTAGLWNQGEDLKRLRDASDGYMDDVLVLRDSYAADIIYLIVDQKGGGGKGNILSLEDPDPAARAFAISNSLDEYTAWFPHELGHVMGLRHDRYNDPSNKPFPYSHGYVNQEAFADAVTDEQKWHTIMAYGSQCTDADIWCPEIWRFSNPNQRYPDANGDPLGVPGDGSSDAVDGPADAVRSLNDTRTFVANFRRSSTRCAYELSSSEHVVAAGGGAFSIRVAAETRCSWSARAHDGFLSVGSSEPQRGNGDVAYNVAPNRGLARIGFITVAGETLVIYQSGTTASTSVCDRTSAARYAIVLAAKRADCSAVTEFDLLNIGSLDLSRRGIETLKAGDFDGLKYLAVLDLSGNGIARLPDDLLRDLTNLKVLNISNNRLIDLPPETFAGLSELTELDLEFNELPALSDGVFVGLTKLEWLKLTGNELRSIPDGIFSELRQLRYLSLLGNQLSGLRKEMFEGPTRYSQLNLGNNPLKTLAEDVFSEIDVWQLFLRATQLSEIPPGLFRNLPDLGRLTLDGNQIATLPARVFPGGNIRRLDLSDNRLQVLPDELFVGFTSHFCARRNMDLDLRDNPGSPFPLELELARLDAGPASDGPASIAVRVASSTPLPLTVGLSAPGGNLSKKEVTVPNGSVVSEPVEVTGAGPVTVRLVGEPEVPETYKGITIVLGEPLRLFAPALTPDFNGDGQVDLTDFLAFAGKFGTSDGDEGYESRFDLDGDGAIGLGDFLVFANAFGKPVRSQ